MTRRVRTLIVEDQPLFRKLLCEVLEPCPTIEIVGAVDTPDEAIRAAVETHAEVVLVDIELGSEMTGVDAATQIRHARPSTGIVVLTSHSEQEYLRTLVTRGWSYLLKSSVGSADTIVRAIESSALGYVTLDPTLVGNSGQAAAGRGSPGNPIGSQISKKTGAALC